MRLNSLVKTYPYFNIKETVKVITTNTTNKNNAIILLFFLNCGLHLFFHTAGSNPFFWVAWKYKQSLHDLKDGKLLLPVAENILIWTMSGKNQFSFSIFIHHPLFGLPVLTNHPSANIMNFFNFPRPWPEMSLSPKLSSTGKQHPGFPKFSKTTWTLHPGGVALKGKDSKHNW